MTEKTTEVQGKPFKRIQVIANPAAGAQEAFPNILNRVFRKYDVAWDMRLTHRLGDGARLAREAIAQGADCVVSYGGDGTVMDVASGMVHSGVPMGILPGGTGNAVAGALKIPLTTEAAAEVIASGQFLLDDYDVGEVNGKSFVLRADLGILAESMGSVDRSSKDRLGALAYAIALIQKIVQPRQTRFTITVDGQPMEAVAAGCMVVNMDNIGTIHRGLGRSVSPRNGMLHLYLLKNDAISLVQTMASLADLVDYEAIFGHWAGREITVETAEPIAYLLDGDTEMSGSTPATFRSLPGALRLVTPIVSDDERDDEAVSLPNPPAP